MEHVFVQHLEAAIEQFARLRRVAPESRGLAGEDEFHSKHLGVSTRAEARPRVLRRSRRRPSCPLAMLTSCARKFEFPVIGVGFVERVGPLELADWRCKLT